MKTKVFAMLLALMLAVGYSSISASAEFGNQCNGETMVLYTLHGQYSISIPASVSISDGNTMQIYADYLHIIDGESVVVSISEQSFDPNNIRFPLSDNKGNTLYCEINVNRVGADPTEARSIYQTDAQTSPVISYTANNIDDIAEIRIIPNVEQNSVAGSYSGILYFNISLITE